MSVEDIQNPPPSGEEGGALGAIGNRLATARQQQKLEPGTVASRLHLSVAVVDALESGNRTALPAMTFVRGYIKSYARLLGLDETQLLALLPETENYRSAPLKAVGMSRARRPQPIGKWLMWIVAVAALVLLMVYGVPTLERVWTRVQQPEESGALQLPLGQQNEVTPLAPEPGAESPAEEPAVVPESEEQGDAPLPPADTGAAASPTESQPPSPVQPVATPAAVTDISSPALIELRFRQDSWVEMESHGRKLVVGIQSAGSERSVRAEPPVQLLLGNAPGVEVEYRGRPVDLKPYQRGKVARLTLAD